MNTSNLLTTNPSRRRYTILLFRTAAIFVSTLTLLLAVGSDAAQASAPAQVGPPAQVASPTGSTSVQLASPLRQVLSVAPGGSYEGEIALVNSSKQAATVQVSQVDFLPAEAGASYPEPGSLPRSNASWLELNNPGDVVVPAGAQVVVPYRIQVPDDLGLTGSYWSMILLTPSDAASVQETQEGEVRTSVRTQFRYGVSVVTTLGDSGENRVASKIPTLSARKRVRPPTYS